MDFEYLALVQAEGERGGQGRAARYRLLGRAGPETSEVLGLLAPAELKTALEARP